MLEMKKRLPFKILWLVVLAGLFAVALLPMKGHRIDPLDLNRSNQAYLDSAIRQSLGTFAVLSGIKVGLAIVEGTEVGVGFGVEIGDAVQSVYDYIDLAWRVVIASSAILLGTKYILQMADLLGPWFFLITLIFLFIFKLLQWTTRRLASFKMVIRDALMVLSVLTVSIYIILPLSITGGRYLSKRITQPSIEEAGAGLKSIEQGIQKESDGKDDLFSKISKGTDKVLRIAKYVSQKADELSLWILKLIAGYLFDAIIFPLTLFIFMVWLTKGIIRYIFQTNQSRTLRDDLEQIAQKYFVQNKNLQSPANPNES